MHMGCGCEHLQKTNRVKIWEQNGYDLQRMEGRLGRKRVMFLHNQPPWMVAHAMDLDGGGSDNVGGDGGIRIVQRDQGDVSGANKNSNKSAVIMEEENVGAEITVVDPKRRRMSIETIVVTDEEKNINGPMLNAGPKNGIEAGPVVQARLDK